MRDPENIRKASELDIDLMGFIFWNKSPRYVTSFYPPSNPEIRKVGIFVNEDYMNVMEVSRKYKLDYIQLHGSESSVYIDKLRLSLGHEVNIIKAINDVSNWKKYDGHVDMFLFDTKCNCYGGSGNKFDWSVLEMYDGKTPFLLSGGIGPDDAELVKRFNHPMCIGIDLNSKFEDLPGLKNIEKLRNFIKTVRNNE